MGRKLKVNVGDLENCERELKDSVEKLVQIQEKLQRAIDALKDDGGWDTIGSQEYMKRYNNTWIQGITDRKAIMDRMCLNIHSAVKEYEHVEEEASRLSIHSY